MPATNPVMKDGFRNIAIGLLGPGDLQGLAVRKRALDRPISTQVPTIPYGAKVAIKEFLSALLYSDEALEFNFYSESPCRTASRRRVRRHHLSHLLHGDIPDVMLDIGGSLWPPFYARNTSGHLFPITITHHTISYPQLLHSYILRLVLEPSYECDFLVGTSRAALQAIRNLIEHVTKLTMRADGYRGDYTVIPLGVDTSRFRPRPQGPARDRLKLPRNAFVIMCVGRLSAADKMDLLPFLRIVKRVTSRDGRERHVRLVIVGNGEPPYLHAIRKEAEQLGIGALIDIISGTKSEEMHWIYPAADVVVGLSDNIQETFGLAPIEAMACGIPQVVADWDGYRDTVVHNGTGFLIPTRWLKCDDELLLWAPLREGNWHYDHLFLAQSVVVDLDAAEAAIRALMDSQSLRSEMAKASRKRAVSEFDWSVVIGRYMNLWREQIRIASRLSRHIPNDLSLRPCYFKAFSQYASEILSTLTWVAITHDGKGVVSGECALPPLRFYSDKTIIDEAIAHRLLKVLVANEKALRITAVADALIPKIEISVVCRHLMWLMKYGFVARRLNGHPA